MKTVICKPNTKTVQYGALKDLAAIEPPIWHAVLAEYYQADHILDAEVENLTEKETVQAIMRYDPDRVVLLATGSHPSAFVQQKDAVLRLDILLSQSQKDIVVINQLPCNPMPFTPRWDLLSLDKYRCHNWHSWTNQSKTTPYGVTYTSISCPFRCSFCVVHQFYGEKYEERPIDSILSDLLYFANQGIRNVKFMDELFIYRKQRVHEICDAIIAMNYEFNIWAYARIDIMDEDLLKKMRQAGIRWLAYGIESGNDTIRKAVLKGNFTRQRIKDVIKMTRDNDICVIGNYMFGFQEDSLETMQETLDLAQELCTEYVNFYCVVAYPQTPLYQQLQDLGVGLPTDFNQYAQTYKGFKPLPTKHVTAKEVLTFRDNAFKKYFSDPFYLHSIGKKFGVVVVDEINSMLQLPMKRL